MINFAKTIVLTTAGLISFTLCGSAATVFSAALVGANEQPATGSAGTGSALVTLTGDSLSVSVTFTGLTSPDVAAHIHCCGPVGMTEPVALPFTAFQTGVTAGTYSQVFDLTSASVYSPAFVTASGGTVPLTEAAFIAGLNAGQTYANIHTAQFPGGEIRGQLEAVPEPATILSGGLALCAFALFRCRRFLRLR